MGLLIVKVFLGVYSHIFGRKGAMGEHPAIRTLHSQGLLGRDGFVDRKVFLGV
jgi:hypothetical protein